MRHLIFTVAYGPLMYKIFARALVRSLREAGFDDHIVVLSDDDEVNADAIISEGCTVIDCSTMPLDEPVTRKKVVRGKALKFYLPATWDCTRYDTITFLDSDTMCTSGREFPLDKVCIGNLFGLSLPKAKIGAKLWYEWAASAMDTELLDRVKDRKVVHSGEWTIRSADFIRFCDGCRAIFKRSPNSSDMACVNAFLYANEDTFQWDFLPLEAISISAHGIDSDIIHHSGRPLELGRAITGRYTDMQMPWDKDCKHFRQVMEE